MSLKNSAREQPYQNLEEGIASDPALRGSGVQARAERAPSVAPISVTETATPLVSIQSPASESLLEATYAYLSAYCFACLPPQVAQRLNVAIYELYANALRYGVPGSTVGLELRQLPGGVRLTVRNDAELARRETLARHVARVKADPEAAFSGEMDRFTSGSSTPSMLGLVRVMHESRLDMELEIEGSRVEVTTVCYG